MDQAARPPVRKRCFIIVRLYPAVMIDLETRFKVPVIEAYGMTEAAHQMASNPLPPLPRKSGSVGIAAGTEIVILNPQGQIVETGQQGEISIAGQNVTLGYENNREANKHAYTDGWFRTGDLGYFDDEAYLFISGRIKEIINRGGEKISPREIDEVLLEHPQIAQAVAFALPHPSLGEDLVAGVVLTADASISAEQIRQYLFERLVDFKVPSQVLIIDEIPKGATGKLQRIGLAEKLSDYFEKSYVAPRNDLEIFLATQCTELLKVESVGIDDNFFGLGGDSLIATQLIARVATEFTVELPVVSVFHAPTIAELAQLIEQQQWQIEADILTQLDKLSDADAIRLLQEKS